MTSSFRQILSVFQLKETVEMLTSSTPAKRVATLSAVVLGTLCATGLLAQQYTFTTFAGTDGGPAWFDGDGTAARFRNPWGIASDSSGNFYVADGNETIRKIVPGGEVSTLAGLAETYGSNDGSGSAARFDQLACVAVDATGNVFVTDGWNQTIRKISPTGEVSSIAGVAGQSGGVDGNGPAARFYFPAGIAVDGAGNLYIADRLNFAIRRVSPAGNVTTLAGKLGVSGLVDGTGESARFEYPMGVVVGAGGVLYVADTSSIRKVTTAGVVTTLAGLPGNVGSADGTGVNARFRNLNGLALDADGNLWVADGGNNTIRKVTAAGEVTTFAGAAGQPGLIDGTGSAARFNNPAGVAFDSNGNALVTDLGNGTIRKITPGGVVTTVAGGQPNLAGSLDGVGTSARFRGPRGIAFDTAGNLYVADSDNHTIRRITPGGVVTTLAGAAGQYGSEDGTGAAARFSWVEGVAVDTDGNVYVADFTNHTIRKVTPAGEVTTLAGLAGSPGSVDGTGSAARFNNPYGVAVDSSGNVYVGDQGNHTIRKITPGGEVTTLAGLAGNSGSADGNGSNARFSYPKGVAVDSSGDVYVAESSIRMITPGGDVTTVAAVAASGIVVGASGELYTSDSDRHSIRKISTGGEVVILAGSPNQSGAADGTGGAARFYFPGFLAVAGSGEIYVSDDANNRIRVGRPALAGAMSIDNPAGYVGVSHQLGFSGTASSYEWRMIRKPANSSATLSSTTDPAPSFTPDVNDAFEFQLVATDGASTYIGRSSLVSPTIFGSPIGFTEAAAAQYITIMLSEAVATTVTVDWATADGSAVAGLDYVAANGSLTFAPGETWKQVQVQLLDDAIDEDDEKFFVELTNVVGVQNGGSAIVRIYDDDPMPTLSISDVTVSEGDSGTSAATFTVTLSDVSGRKVGCVVATESGTALPGTDFLPLEPTQLTFAPGETSKSVTVNVLGDSQGEVDETFFVNLTNPTNAVIEDSQAVGTITNDDIVVANPPAALTAAASSLASVAINWSPVTGATGYRVFRRAAGGGYVQIGTPATATFTDNAVSAGKAYLYKVRATDGPIESVDSAADLATTVVFTDATLTSGVTAPKSAHVTELRSAVNAVRQLAGLSASTYTDAGLAMGGTIKAVHVTELRSAIDSARSLLGLPAMSYADAAIQPGVTTIKASNVTELRNAVE